MFVFVINAGGTYLILNSETTLLVFGGYGSSGHATEDVSAIDLSGEGNACDPTTDLPLKIGNGVSAKVGSKYTV